MKIIVIIPCYNEEITIAKVVGDFMTELPDAQICVVDNNSTDRSLERAAAAGAIIKKECRQGKGYVLQSILSETIADLYVVVDGDDTYNASDVHKMIDPIVKGEVDITVAVRLDDYQANSFRSMHFFGNRLITFAVNSVFGSKLKDVLSGFRVFNERFAKSIPIASGGFEVETEMTLQGLRHGFVFREINSFYKERPEGSKSKLSTYKDGMKIFLIITSIFMNYNPLKFFGIISGLLLLLSITTGSVVIYEYVKFSYIYRVPTAILSVGAMLMSALSFLLGILLDSIGKRTKDLEYLISMKR
jgi:glycosyltransferase involved in cell wall biosynthesis